MRGLACVMSASLVAVSFVAEAAKKPNLDSIPVLLTAERPLLHSSQGAEQELLGAGTGFIVRGSDERLFLVTASHIVDDLLVKKDGGIDPGVSRYLSTPQREGSPSVRVRLRDIVKPGTPTELPPDVVSWHIDDRADAAVLELRTNCGLCGLDDQYCVHVSEIDQEPADGETLLIVGFPDQKFASQSTDEYAFYLLNADVKGGFSGAPVFRKTRTASLFRRRARGDRSFRCVGLVKGYVRATYSGPSGNNTVVHAVVVPGKWVAELLRKASSRD